MTRLSESGAYLQDSDDYSSGSGIEQRDSQRARVFYRTLFHVLIELSP
jgi:hypothetical protein